LASTAVYFVVIITLGAFTSEELELGKEGLGFIRAFLQEWSPGAMQRKPLLDTSARYFSCSAYRLR
jgi:hypothetical protein